MFWIYLSKIKNINITKQNRSRKNDLQYHFREMKLSLKFIYLVPILFVLLTDAMFAQLGLYALEKPIIVLLTLGAFVFIKEYSPFMRKWFYVYVLFFLALCIEAYYLYNKPLGYLHVSAKIMICLSIFCIYGFYKRFDKITIKGVIFIIITGFILNAVIINHHAFTLGAFLGHERGIVSETVYLLTIPLLYNLNMFLKHNSIVNLFSFFALIGVIFFLQHRTVWVTSSISLGINVLLLSKTDIRPKFTAFIIATFFISLVSIILTSFVLSDEKVSAKIAHSIEQIANPTGNDKDDEESTSEWRYIQFQSYWPYVEENPVFGMRFYGFELPIQFYSQKDNKPVFEDGTGHHFHSFYLDRLFYQGWVGLLLLILPPFTYIAYLIFKLKQMDNEQLVLVAYLSSSLIFGVSYNWPNYFYGIIGYTIMKLESPNIKNK
jgi:hypothetical protein